MRLCKTRRGAPGRKASDACFALRFKLREGAAALTTACCDALKPLPFGAGAYVRRTPGGLPVMGGRSDEQEGRSAGTGGGQGLFAQGTAGSASNHGMQSRDEVRRWLLSRAASRRCLGRLCLGPPLRMCAASVPMRPSHMRARHRALQSVVQHSDSEDSDGASTRAEQAAPLPLAQVVSSPSKSPLPSWVGSLTAGARQRLQWALSWERRAAQESGPQAGLAAIVEASEDASDATLSPHARKGSAGMGAAVGTRRLGTASTSELTGDARPRHKLPELSMSFSTSARVPELPRQAEQGRGARPSQGRPPAVVLEEEEFGSPAASVADDASSALSSGSSSAPSRLLVAGHRCVERTCGTWAPIPALLSAISYLLSAPLSRGPTRSDRRSADPTGCPTEVSLRRPACPGDPGQRFRLKRFHFHNLHAPLGKASARGPDAVREGVPEIC